ncbi:MAG: hypothetical protein JO360_14795, partial [Acidobacteria bacterium]|nr:hypothetical protein [Acidobacteriota bacterium]
MVWFLVLAMSCSGLMGLAAGRASAQQEVAAAQMMPSDDHNAMRHALPSADPATNPISEYEFPTPKGGPSIINVDRSGTVWVAMARAGKIGQLRDGQLREYALPANSFPVGLVTDAGGHVWYSDIRRNKIGRLDPTSAEVKDFDIPTKDSWPFSLAFDSGGKLWFTERVGNKIGHLNTLTGEVQEFTVSSPNCQPAGLAVTPGGQVFFTENSGHKIGHFNPKTGKLTEHQVPTPMKSSLFYGLAGITSDPQGNIWFAILDGRLGYLRRHGQDYEEVREIALPNAATRPAGMAVDAWGIVWFTELDGNSISSYNPALEEFRRYAIPTGSPDPRPMGPPEVTARGELPVPGSVAKTSRPFGIAVDPQGTVWFSEQYAHKVGKLTPPALEVFQPRGLISGVSAPVKVQARALSGAPIQYLIDDQPINAGEKLDITFLTPGAHTLRAVATRDGRQLAVATSTFSVNPTLETIRQQL